MAFIDFRQLQQDISILEVLEHYGLSQDFTEKPNGQLAGACPLPNHKSGKKSQPFKVTPEKNLFKCFHPDCGEGGNQITFVNLMESCSYYEAAQKMLSWSEPGRGTAEEGELVSEAQGTASEEDVSLESESNAVLSFNLKNLVWEHQSLAKLNLKTETYQYFEAGYDNGNGFMAKRLAIPLHNVEGQRVAYLGYATHHRQLESGSLWKVHQDFRADLEIFNYHRVKALLKEGPQDVIFVHDIMDALRLKNAGYEAVLALMSTKPSKLQVKRLEELLRGNTEALETSTTLTVISSDLHAETYQRLTTSLWRILKMQGLISKPIKGTSELLRYHSSEQIQELLND